MSISYRKSDNSISFSINSDNDSLEEYKYEIEKEKEKDNQHILNYTKSEDKILFIICPKCGQIPKITFNSLKFINISCECSFIKNAYIDSIQDYFISISNKKIKIDNYTCIYHPHKKFNYYCTDCKANICKYCKIKDDRHKTHDCIRLISFREKYKIIEENIESEKENEKNFIDIFKSLETIYNNYPNYSLYETFNELYNFSCNKKEDNQNLMIIEVENEIKIKSSKALMENIDNLNKIIIIEIIRQNFYDINDLCNLKFEQLKILNLSENNIQDISPLKNLVSPNLKELILLKNKIDDKNIDYIKDFKFPEIVSLHFYDNFIKDYKFFKEVTIFQKLEVLFIGSNNFIKNIEHINLNEAKYEFKNLKKIGLTNGVFSDESIKLLSCFYFPELQELYLSGNNLSSLSCLDMLICPELNEIWLKDNRIKELSVLNKFKSLKKINLENNLIDKIDYLKQFTGPVTILLSNNKIDLNNDRNKIIINEIKNNKIKLVFNYS